jgi:hypothetical protein
MKLESSRHIFEKHSNLKFHENPSSGNRVVLCGRTDTKTDGQNEANNRFTKFCERAQNRLSTSIKYETTDVHILIRKAS